MRKLFRSLGARISFYVIVLCTAIFCAISIVFHSYSHNREEQLTIMHTHALLENMAMKIGQQLLSVEHNVEKTLPLIQQNRNNPADMRKIVEQMVTNNQTIMGGCIAFEPYFYPQEGKYFMEYVWLDTLEQIHYKRLDNENYNYFNMKWYSETKELQQGIWSEPYFDEGAGNEIMTTFSLPVKDENGKVFAVLTSDVSLKQFVTAIDTLRFQPESYTFLLSLYGTYLTHWNKEVILNETIFSRAAKTHNKELEMMGEEMLKGKKGTARLSMKNTEVLAFYTSVPYVGWKLCNICPYHTIMNSLSRTTHLILLILSIGFLLLLISIRWIVRRETSPLGEFATAARKIAAGNFDSPLPGVESRDEMRSLHDSFIYMQKSLLTYIEELKVTTAAKQRIESELQIAHELQMSLLPNIFPPFPGRKDVDLYAVLTPAKEVGGDLYDFFIRDEKLFFVVGDVSGKGIPASLFMAITRSLYRIMAGNNESPANIACQLNHAVADHNDANMFITMFFGVLHLDSGKLTFCNAGHNPPLIVPATGKCSYMQVIPNLPIGILDDFNYQEQELQLNDQGLLIYTDGLTEAEDPEHNQLGEERVKEKINGLTNRSAYTVVNELATLTATFAGTADQSDDLTLLYLKLNRQ